MGRKTQGASLEERIRQHQGQIKSMWKSSQLEEALQFYSSHLATRLVEKRPVDSTLDLASVIYAVQNQYVIELRNGLAKKIPTTPEYARAVLAMKEKAIELAPQFVHNHAQHIQRQRFPAQIIKSEQVEALLIIAGSYIGWEIGRRLNLEGPFLNLGVIILGCTAGYRIYKLATALVDRKANAESLVFQNQVKEAFYAALSNKATGFTSSGQQSS